MNQNNREVSTSRAAAIAAIMALACCTYQDESGPYADTGSVDSGITDTAGDTSDTGDTGGDTAAPTECSDGVDNDGNGVADGDDTNCYGADGNYDPDRTTETVQQCRDGFDNDSDGLTDSADMGQCPTGWYDFEAAECNNGIDDDGDGWMDSDDAATGTVSPDPQCENQYDISETEDGAQYPTGLETYYEALVNPPEADTGDTALLLQNTRKSVIATWQNVVDLRVV